MSHISHLRDGVRRVALHIAKRGGGGGGGRERGYVPSKCFFWYETNESKHQIFFDI